MYSIFVMVGILLWSSISKTFFLPSLWTLEIAQFAMVAYYILGGPYSIQLGANVRMDLFYSGWTTRKKAQVDAITVLFLIFYLIHDYELLSGVSKLTDSCCYKFFKSSA
jgi:TRAP-type C4-dicarboxylate transport system permease small subunit